MTWRLHIAALRARITAFGRQESGASLVEFGVVILIFLFLMFAIIDMGRLAYTWSSAQKATQLAARIAAVRPPVCAGVPERNLRGTAGATVTYGTMCRFSSGTCAAPTAPAVCTGSTTNATANEIFTAIQPLLPAGSAASNLRYTYAFDPNLGFLGGPYVPMVTVELVGLQFSFVSSLGLLIAPVIGRPSNLGADVALPSMSVSVPGEDLAAGTAG